MSVAAATVSVGTAVVSAAMAVVAATVIPAAPVPVKPRIIARAVVSIIRIGSVTVIGTVPGIIARSVSIITGAAHPDSYPHMHARVSLAGKAENSQQSDDQQYFFHNGLFTI
jgi:hypothetical protein